MRCINPTGNPKGWQKGVFICYLLSSTFVKSIQRRLWQLAGKCGAIHTQLSLLGLFPRSMHRHGVCCAQPTCGNITGKEKHNGPAEAVQVQSKGPGANFSETETQTTVKKSLELDPVLQEEGLLRVQTVNHLKKISQLLFSTP